MKFLRATVLLAMLAAAASAFADPTTLTQINELELQGQFKQAANAIHNALADHSLGAAERKQLEFELDRLERIKRDFPYTQDELFAVLQKALKNLKREEFEGWVAEGRFDSREIDGERRFMGSSVSNLYFRYPELETRRTPPKNSADFEKAVLAACRAIKIAAETDHKPYVLPKRFHMTMTVTVEANAAPAGELIRAWLPIPRSYPFQTDFAFVKTTSPRLEIAPATSPIRSAFLELPARKNKPTVFKLDYEYTTYGVWFNVQPEQVTPRDPNDAALAPFVREGPHVMFSPEMRALSEKIVGDEKNPARIAKATYDWIAENIKYSFAIEYSTIRNIGEYCRSRGYGDCGQEALLFITLCRLNGIPARWQSGWNTFPGGKTMHDWTEINLAPYGWMPVDPYMGIWAMRYVRSLPDAEKRELRDFYFGGLDQWRMSANSDHSQELWPSKGALRSDTVDFQRGELEWGGNNIYFDQLRYALEVKEVKLRAKSATAKKRR